MMPKVSLSKLLIRDDFPGTPLLGNISITINATALKKYFLNLHMKGNKLVYNVTGNFEL